MVKDECETDKEKRVGTETATKLDSSLKPPDKGKQAAAGSSSVATESPNDKLHIFTWLEFSTPTGNLSSQEDFESVSMQLQEMDDFLRKEVTRLDRHAYQACPEGARLDSLTYLEEQSLVVKRNSHLKRDFEDRVDVFNAAEIVFSFFLPLEATGPTVGKFWGAIRRILQVMFFPKTQYTPPGERATDAMQMPKPDISRETRYSRATTRSTDEVGVTYTRVELRELTQEIQSFTNIVSHAQPLERANIEVPIQLIRAWIYVLLALAKATNKTTRWVAHFDNAKGLLKEGMAEVMQALPSEDLLAREVVQPTEVVTLLSLKLLEDTTGTYPNLDTVYSEYLNALVLPITPLPIYTAT